ncbi:hypothetical protein B1C81_13625 [Streptomyces sp. HG99]|nr:hypothetical protein B1C81_13625 [Streptomyces sp. HG99]
MRTLNNTDHVLAEGAEGSGWDNGPEDDSGAVLKAVGRQIKAWRERAGLRQADTVPRAQGVRGRPSSATERPGSGDAAARRFSCAAADAAVSSGASG